MICASCHLTECECRVCQCHAILDDRWRQLRREMIQALAPFKNGLLPLLCAKYHAERYYAEGAK